MNLQQWSFVAEVVSSIAVVLSLCFLVIEIRLYTRQARQDSMDVVTSRRHELLAKLAENGELASIVWKGCAGLPRLEAHEWARFSLYIYTLVLEYERTWLKAHSGALDKNVMAAWDDALGWWIKFPGVRAWWRGDPPGFHADFRNYVDAALAKVAVDPVTAATVAAAFRASESQPAAAPRAATDTAPRDLPTQHPAAERPVAGPREA